MKNRKAYLNIEVEDQDNIGCIEFEKKDYFLATDTNAVLTIEKTLVKALEEHFDCEVKTLMAGEVKQAVPLKIEFKVVVCDNGEDYNETVTLTETWLYKTSE